MFSNPTLTLLRQMVLRDLRLRYRSTFLGFFWSLAKPGAMILLFFVIFQLIIGMRSGILSNYRDGASYGVFVAIGIITWTFVSGAIIEGINAYLNHQHLISKAAFWRPVLPLGCVLSHWVHYLFAQTVLVILLGVFGYHSWGFELLYLAPLSVLELALVAGVVWILAWLQVLARDTLQFVELGLMVWFYGSPIIYPASLAVGSNLLTRHLSETHAALLYLANPLAPLLVVRQWILTSNFLVEAAQRQPSPEQLRDAFMIALFLISLLVVLAWSLNRRVNLQIADRI